MHSPHKIRFISMLALLVALVGFAPGAALQAAGPDSMQRTTGGVAGEDLYVAGPTADVSAPVKGDVLAAGGSVHVGANVGGNAVLAGGSVSISQAVGQDLFAAGGSVEVRGRIADDVRAAGGSVRVNAEVGGDLLAAGGEVVVGPGTVVTGQTRLAGGEVEIRGRLSHGLRARGEHIALHADVRGDVDLEGDTIVIGPDARVQGKLVWASPEDARIDPAARISGGVERRPFDEELPHPGWAGWWFIAWVVLPLALLARLVVATVLWFVFPRFSAQASLRVARHPWKSLVLGFALAVCIPVAALVLLITVIGIPLGVALVLTYPLLAALGMYVTVVRMSEWAAARLFARGRAPVGWRLVLLWLAVLVVFAVFLVPWFGPLVVCVAMLFGLGGTALELAARYNGAPPLR